MTHNKWIRSLKVYVCITIVLFLSILVVLKLVDNAIASSNDDFYNACIDINNSRDLNSNNENNSLLLNRDYRYSYKDYIEENIKQDYCKNNKFESKNIIILKQTLADLSKMNTDTTLDELHYGSYSEAEIAMYDDYCVLYELDENSDYYVGYVNTVQGHVQDVVFARTNYNGEVLNDCIYDYDTGLIYVPKSYTKSKGLENKESVLEVQMQMLIGVWMNSNNKVATPLNISIEYDEANKENATPMLNALDTTIAIPFQNENSKQISVLANDNINITDKSYYSDGVILINESPANLISIKVKIENNEDENKSGFKTPLDDIPALPYSLNRDLAATSGGYFNYVGAKYNEVMCVHYDETPSSAPYQDRLYGVNGFVTDENMQTFANSI
ncbi:MAG: hypothetical protein Q4F54_00995 [Coriobacteriia bacterium]|nr:hypothetical protein [Coriobacteriia bacterium]